MTALAADKSRNRLGDAVSIGEAPVAASTDIKAGALVTVINNTGYAINAATATTHLILGVAVRRANNSAGAAGDIKVAYETGVFEFVNSTAGDAITQADVGKVCYVVDNDTVAKTDGTTTRSKAGIIAGLNSATGGVFVRVGLDMITP